MAGRDSWGTPPSEGLVWTKSTFSGTGNCVEVTVRSAEVLVRDSKDPDGPTLTFTASEWDSFLIGVRRGQFNRSRLSARIRGRIRRSTRGNLPLVV